MFFGGSGSGDDAEAKDFSSLLGHFSPFRFPEKHRKRKVSTVIMIMM